MKVLFLGPPNSPVARFLAEKETVISATEPIGVGFMEAVGPDFIVSYGYCHIVPPEVLAMAPAVNLHISYLPWNRGNDPNFWSFVEDTPKGVTIHYMAAGLDRGDIIAQETVELDYERDTLRTSHIKLCRAIERLFMEQWAGIKAGTCDRARQEGAGSYHRTADKDALNLLADGWDTPVSILAEYALETQMSDSFWNKYRAEVRAMA